MIGSDPDRRPEAAPVPGLRLILAGAAVLGAGAVLGQRLWIALRQPLWFDETWTGMVASAPDWNAFVREVWLDVNAPLYYLLMRAWSAVFGVSDLALKAPGLIAAALAGALPLLIRVRGLSWEARLTWAVLLTAWWGVDTFLDARCYGLLLGLAVLQSLAFARLIRDPSRCAALAWCAVASAAILTQYYAIALAAVQGLMFLALHRQRAVRAWPAALAFAPAFAWIVVHSPRLAQFATEDVAWHPTLSPLRVIDMIGFTLGPATWATLVILGLVLAAAVVAPRLAASASRDEPAADMGPLIWTAASGAIALGLVLASAMARPTLTARYLIPEVPAMLLGVVLVARSSRRAHLAYLALAGLYFAIAICPPAAVSAALRSQSPYGLAAASDMLRAQAVTDVTFIWDHPAAKVMAPESLRRVGGFFFQRAGVPVRVTALNVDPAHDPNQQALAAAHGPRPGIIWIYDRTGRTAAAKFPPAIERSDPHWSCQTIGDGRIGSVACWRR